MYLTVSKRKAFAGFSYQEAQEQEFVATDDELLGIIALGRDTK
jgi:hypothetical protein